MVRIKQRYLLLNILYPDNTNPHFTDSATSSLKFHAPTPGHINSQAFLNIVRSQITHLFGDHGMGVSISSLKVIYYSQATSTAILRVPRSYFRLAWAALTLLQELPPRSNNQQQGIKCVIRVIRVSGTIKKAEEELLRCSRREIVRAKLANAAGESSILDRWNSATDGGAVPEAQEDVGHVEDPSEDDSEGD